LPYGHHGSRVRGQDGDRGGRIGPRPPPVEAEVKLALVGHVLVGLAAPPQRRRAPAQVLVDAGHRRRRRTAPQQAGQHALLFLREAHSARAV
jgi:hypothetical protein